MVPWPIALVCVGYAVIATSAAALMVRGQGLAVCWSGLWALLSAAVVVGLAGLRPWARRLAVWASAGMMLSALALSLLLAIQAQPDARHSLLATGMAGLQLLLVRYLTRPHVKRWFEQPVGTQDPRLKTQDSHLVS